MSYYEPQPSTSWQNSRPGWDARSGTTPIQNHYHRPHASESVDLTNRITAQMKPEDPAAFGSQIDAEVDRAVDNLVKSGKMFAPPRRESMPVMGPRGFPVEHDSRMVTPLPTRHYSVQDFDVMRSPSAANLQNFYATQRFQPRPSEAEQMMQAKRRLAAQRERDLRNYHQEQQFNRTLLAEISTYGKDRVMSPGAMTEEERRDLIARQHRALYTGHPDAEEGSQLDDNGRPGAINSNGPSAPPSTAGGTRGPSSPLSAFDLFGLQQNGQNGNVDVSTVQTPAAEQLPQGAQTTGAGSPSRSRTNSASSPSSKSATFSLFDNAGAQGQSGRTAASSPGGSPPRGQRGVTPVTSSGVAPIGTRPTAQMQNPAVANKRSTTPLPSPLSYGFAAENDPFNNLPKERSASAASNNSGSAPQGAELGWSKVWGAGTKGLGPVASVWG
ncbi:hypothetical protein RUND412_000488 [Rhizina undulata]